MLLEPNNRRLGEQLQHGPANEPGCEHIPDRFGAEGLSDGPCPRCNPPGITPRRWSDSSTCFSFFWRHFLPLIAACCVTVLAADFGTQASDLSENLIVFVRA